MSETILYNGKIISCDAGNHIHKSIYISGDRIKAVGTDENVLAYANEDTLLIDLKGRTIIPGIIETHSHFTDAALSGLDDFVYIRSVKELLEHVKCKAKELKNGEWIHLKNTYPTRLEECRFPTLNELDSAAPDNPVFVDAMYAGQVNSCALKVVGIDENYIPACGSLLKDDKTNKLNGTVFICTDLFRSHLKKRMYRDDEICRAVMTLQKEYNALGITTVVDGSTQIRDISAYNRLYDNGMLNMRLIYTCAEYDIEKIDNISEKVLSMKNAVETPAEWGRLAFLKAGIDGGILTGTSFMRRPYGKGGGVFGIQDQSFPGICRITKPQLLLFVKAANDLGLQMTAHSIGDAACDLLISTYEEADRIFPVSRKRFGIIHADFTDRDMLLSIKKLGLIVFSQPAWHYMDGSVLNTVLDDDIMEGFLPYADIYKDGIVCAAGSDHMIGIDSVLSQNPYNPFLAIYNMVTRKTRKGDYINTEQQISRTQALKMYTINGAFATFDECKKGSLEQGKLADLVVLSDDILSCPEDSISKIHSVLTIVGGRIVYRTDVV